MSVNHKKSSGWWVPIIIFLLLMAYGANQTNDQRSPDNPKIEHIPHSR